MEPDLLINLSASPWHLNKEEQRKDLLRKVVEKVQCPVSSSTQSVETTNVFDGHSMSFDRNGDLITGLHPFKSALRFTI